MRNYSWSPDSKWIAFEMTRRKNHGESLSLFSRSEKIVSVTDGWFDSSDPSFSNDGKYLFLVSNRSFNPTYSETEWNHAYVDMSKIYLITLAKDTKSPFAPKSDEVEIKDTTKDSGKKEKDKKEDKKDNGSKDVKVNIDGITSRIIEIPVECGKLRTHSFRWR